MGGSTNTTTEQGTAPNAAQQPFLNFGWQQARDLYGRGGPQQYRGDWTAGFTPNEQAAQRGLTDYANTGGRDYTQRAIGASNFALNAPDIANNPYLSKYIEAAVRPIQGDLDTRVLPGVRDQSTMAGAYGGSRQGIMEGLAVQGAQRQAGDVATNIANSAYGQGLQAQTAALQNAPNIFKLGMAPELVTGAVGTQQREMNQAGIDQQRQMFEYEQMLPYLMLQQYMASVGGDYGSTGTSETKGPNLFEKIFGDIF
jgi:hypothetical protein